MGVSKNNGTPKWIVYKGKPYEQLNDVGVPLFLETPIFLLPSYKTKKKNVKKLSAGDETWDLKFFVKQPKVFSTMKWCGNQFWKKNIWATNKNPALLSIILIGL